MVPGEFKVYHSNQLSYYDYVEWAIRFLIEGDYYAAVSRQEDFIGNGYMLMRIISIFIPLSWSTVP
jgi:hypothetical protein